MVKLALEISDVQIIINVYRISSTVLFTLFFNFAERTKLCLVHVPFSRNLTTLQTRVTKRNLLRRLIVHLRIRSVHRRLAARTIPIPINKGSRVPYRPHKIRLK
jgi:hypothetical protein